METIFALASAQGKAGVAVVRISGPRAFEAGRSLAGSLPEPRRSAVRVLTDASGEFLDEALVLCFQSGASFTGEDVVELHLHGSLAVVQAVLRNLGSFEGLRFAEPGEFTRRALENGRLDLTQVEALADLIESETEAQRRQALRIFSGALGDKVSKWREDIVRAAALLEATIDFADEDVPVDVTSDVVSLIDSTLGSIKSELAGFEAAERVRDGFEVAIVGPPNAGKSTLLNHLAQRQAALVSDIPGTTRDVIEVKMDIGGFSVTFLDTAGLRDTPDPVEKLGVDLARSRAEMADLRLHLVDQDGLTVAEVRDGDIIRIAKQDNECVGGVSGKTGAGVADLLDELQSKLVKMSSSAGLVSRERHRICMHRGVSHLENARELSLNGIEVYDISSEELRLAAFEMQSLVGMVDVEHILDEVFNSFCIGK